VHVLYDMLQRQLWMLLTLTKVEIAHAWIPNRALMLFSLLSRYALKTQDSNVIKKKREEGILPKITSFESA